MAFDEQKQKAFEFAQEVAKQLITLSTAVIAITLTFGKDFVPNADSWDRTLISSSWYFLLASVVFGVWTLMALTGSLDKVNANGSPPSIRTPNVVLPAILQIATFLLGMFAAILFGVRSI